MFRSIGAPEIIIILVVLVLLFGAKRLPDAARSLGRSMRIFKSEVKEMGRDDDDKPSSQQPPAPREVEGRVVEPSSESPAATTPGERTDRDR